MTDSLGGRAKSFLQSLPVETERWLLSILALSFLLLVAGPAGRNPDGLEMIALARSWRGEGPTLPAGGYWPPLWPALIVPLMSFLPGDSAGRLLNLLAAGLATWPLQHLCERIAGTSGSPTRPGRTAARFAVVLYIALPGVREHAVILDARPLSWFLTTAIAALAVSAAQTGSRRRWIQAGALAGLAALNRPEGVLLVGLVATGALLARQPILKTLGLAVAFSLPAILRPGAGVRSWEAFTGPWLGIWPNRDLIALFGANSAPTGYRLFVLRAEAAGVEAAPSSLQNLWLSLPGGFALLRDGLPMALGTSTLLLAIAGAVTVARRGRLPMAGLFLGLALLLPLVLLPQARDQATPATNFLFLVPCGIALATTALAPPGALRPLSYVLFFACLAEAQFGPFRGETPRFLEGTDAAITMREWLRQHPPPTGQVATSLSGRGVVFDAGLAPAMLPSGWERWEGPEGVGVLVTTADLRGGDGGRARMMIEDPRWMVRYVAIEDEEREWRQVVNFAPMASRSNDHALFYLERRRGM